jgi:hypothetical protein
MKRIIFAIIASSLLIIGGGIAKLENWEHSKVLLFAGIIAWIITIVLVIMQVLSKPQRRSRSVTP